MKQKKIQYLQSDWGQKEPTGISFDEHIYNLWLIYMSHPLGMLWWLLDFNCVYAAALAAPGTPAGGSSFGRGFSTRSRQIHFYRFKNPGINGCSKSMLVGLSHEKFIENRDVKDQHLYAEPGYYRTYHIETFLIGVWISEPFWFDILFFDEVNIDSCFWSPDLEHFTPSIIFICSDFKSLFLIFHTSNQCLSSSFLFGLASNAYIYHGANNNSTQLWYFKNEI